MNTPYTFKFDGENWIAHAVALDLVAADPDPRRALHELETICIAQVGFGRKHGRPLREAYFAAPSEYWKQPFFFMEFNPDEFLKWKETPVADSDAPTKES
jgi:hypothetical protein